MLKQLALAAIVSSSLSGAVQAATINVSPPALPLTVGCPPANANANVLQAAINAAAPGDTIVMAPGTYYLECTTVVNKALTIRGAGAGVRPAVDGTPRASGETRIIAGQYNPNGLYGIEITASNVTIDGLYFVEDGTPGRTFRNTIAVMPPGSTTANQTYSNIRVLNNYIAATAAGSRNRQWGGTLTGPVTLAGFELSGNVIKSNDPGPSPVPGGSNWEPIGFRGGNPWGGPGNGTITLAGFRMVNNYIRCAGYFDIAMNLQNNIVSPDSFISANEFGDCTPLDEGTPPGPCPIRSLTPGVHVELDNIGLAPGDCPNLAFPPIEVAIDVRPGDPNNAVNTHSQQLVPIAILGTADFDPCDEVDAGSVVVRNALPVTSATICDDVNDDGYSDLQLKFRARDMDDPTPEECDDPDARLFLTGSTTDGFTIEGSDDVNWVGPACH